MKKNYLLIIGIVLVLGSILIIGKATLSSNKEETLQQTLSRQKICELIISQAWEEHDAAVEMQKEISVKSPKLLKYLEVVHSKLYEENLNKAIANNCGDFQYSHNYGESK